MLPLKLTTLRLAAVTAAIVGGSLIAGAQTGAPGGTGTTAPGGTVGGTGTTGQGTFGTGQPGGTGTTGQATFGPVTNQPGSAPTIGQPGVIGSPGMPGVVPGAGGGAGAAGAPSGLPGGAGAGAAAGDFNARVQFYPGGVLPPANPGWTGPVGAGTGYEAFMPARPPDAYYGQPYRTYFGPPSRLPGYWRGGWSPQGDWR